jgi:hypothetical protein
MMKSEYQKGLQNHFAALFEPFIAIRLVGV